MADAFETRLAALFDEAPEPADTSAFLLEVEARIDARRARRRMMGLVAASGAGVAAAVLLAATGWSEGFADLLGSAGRQVGAALPPLGPPELQTELGWSLVGLAALLLVWGTNRLMEEA